MANDEVGVLGPKDMPGVDIGYLRAKTRSMSGIVSSGIGKPTPPDITLPSADELAKEKLFPVRMLRGYRPVSEYFQVGHEVFSADGITSRIEYRDPPEVEEGQDEGAIRKIPAQMHAKIPVSEARELVRRGIAERSDDIN